MKKCPRFLTVLSAVALFLALVGLPWPGPAFAVEDAASTERPGPWTRFTTRLSKVWASDEWDAYFPFWAWHNRLTYDREHIDRYNEFPLGFGLGRSMTDEDGDFHTLFLMGFKDSNRNFQPIGGYAFMRNWPLDEAGDFSVGLGYTLALTARYEYSYVPFPAPLPLVGFQYKRLAVQATYVPGPRNDGNVLFAWIRWHFD